MQKFFDTARGFSNFARHGVHDGADVTNDMVNSARLAAANWLTPQHQHRYNWLWPLLAGLGLGAIIALLWDPQSGRRRRATFEQRLGGVGRRTGRSARRSLRTASSQARGTIAGLAHSEDPNKEYNDASLAEKVESELFRDPAIPKGSININAERGVVVLRGQVEPDQIDLIAERTRQITGVVDVDNRLRS